MILAVSNIGVNGKTYYPQTYIKTVWTKAPKSTTSQGDYPRRACCNVINAQNLHRTD